MAFWGKMNLERQSIIRDYQTGFDKQQQDSIKTADLH
jgi:hypothetical protein